jgi:tryptophan halogenase
MSQSSPLDIVIAGGGTAGWMAAAALSRFLGPAAHITLVESEAIGTVGVGEATIPQIHLFVGGLGLHEADIVRETNATYKLGIEFEGWMGEGHRYMHAFGIVGRAAGIVPFRQLWHRARAEGIAEDFGHYYFNEVAARMGRMAIPEGPRNPHLGLVHAYHFDASRFAVLLRRLSEERGVTRIEGKIEQVEHNSQSGDIAALLLDGERRVEGSLFIDCTGFRSLLLGQTLGVGLRDWSHYLPCDRALAVPTASGGEPRPYTQSIAHQAGWQWRIPLQHRTGNGHVYCSSLISDDEAAAQLLANIEGERLEDPRPLRFVTGMRKLQWSRNCLALGLAAGFMEPLESTSIHLVQSGVARFLGMFPDRHCDPLLVDQYNRQTRFEDERVRDFLILHYKATERDDTPLWRQCGAMDVPETLARRIELFRRTGLIFREADELFTETGWLQVMLGQRIEPRHYQPLADGLEESKLQAFLSDIRTLVSRAVERLPAHDDFVARTCAPAAPEPMHEVMRSAS